MAIMNAFNAHHTQEHIGTILNADLIIALRVTDSLMMEHAVSCNHKFLVLLFHLQSTLHHQFIHGDQTTILHIADTSAVHPIKYIQLMDIHVSLVLTTLEPCLTKSIAIMINAILWRGKQPVDTVNSVQTVTRQVMMVINAYQNLFHQFVGQEKGSQMMVLIAFNAQAILELKTKTHIVQPTVAMLTNMLQLMELAENVTLVI